MARDFVVVTVRHRLLRFSFVLLLCVGFVWGVSVVFGNIAVHHRPRPFFAKGGFFFKKAERLQLRLVLWQAERPGEVPWRVVSSNVPLDEDFARIRASGFNGIRSWGALTPDQLSVAARHDLYVLQGVGLDRHTRFSVPAERQRELANISRVVQNTRPFRNVIGYVLLTEPSAEHVHTEGIENTQTFLREAADTIRRWDPRALVGFASGPGLEGLDEPTLDFVALNLTPNRATSLTAAIGYSGVLRLWRERLAAGRPFLLSEFGVPVLPPNALPMSGRYSEAEQAVVLPALSDAAWRAGAAGTAISSWGDGWWKTGEVPDDEQSHDVLDPNEWTGLIAFDGINDRLGSPRPALAAMWSHQRAMVTRPVDGTVDAGLIAIEAHVTVRGEILLAVEREGKPAVVLPTLRKGAWASAMFELPADVLTPQRLTISVRRGDEVLARVQRLIHPAGTTPKLTLALSGRGLSRTLVATLTNAEGRPLPDTELRVGTLEASGSYDRTLFPRTDAKGQARVQVWIPPAPARMLIVGAFMPPEADTPYVYETLLVVGEAS